MDLQEKLFYFFFNLILPMGAGYALKKTGAPCGKFLTNVMFFNLLGVTPILTCLSFWKVRIGLSDALLPVLGALMQIVPAAIDFFIAKKNFSDPQQQGGYILSTMFSNRSIVGILSAYILYGTEGYAYSRMVMLFGPLVFFMFGFPLAQYYYQLSVGGKGMSRPAISSVLFTKNQLPVLGLFAGFLLNRGDAGLPPFTNSLIPILVAVNAWFYLVPVGFDLNFKKMWPYVYKVANLIPIKFILMPALFYLLSLSLRFSGDKLGTLVVLSCTPAAVGAVVAAKLNKLDIHLPMAAYLLTTTTYLIFVFPVLVLFFS